MKCKIFKDNNSGSVLVMLMVVIGVLAILGTAIIGLAMSNFKLKMVSSVEKANYYITEAGLEEFYAKIYNVISDAIDFANKKASEELDKYDEELFENTVFLIENGDKIIGDSDIWFLSYKDGRYFYNEEAIKSEVESIFIKSYQEKVKEKIKPGESSLIALDGKISSSLSGVDVNAEIPELEFDSISNKLRINLSSEYEANGIKKRTKLSLDIDTPKYNEPYTVYVKNMEIPVNPLWTKAISSEGDLNINSPITVNGEMYVGKNLNINKDVKFYNAIATLGNIEVGSNVNLMISDVYVSNINLNGSTINLSTTRGSQLYVKDDLLMDNIRQKVSIDGDYYGFSDGSKSMNNTPDKSSAITINSDDIMSGASSLDITGNLSVTGTSYIAGVYQTGETISVKGNYKAYTSLLTSDTTPNRYRDVIYDIIEGTHLMLADTFDDGITKLGVMDKNDFFYYYYLENKEELKLKNIDVRGEIKTLGNIIKRHNITNVELVEKGAGLSLINHIEEFKAMEDKHSLMTKFLGDDVINHIDNGIDDINVIKDTKFVESSFNDELDGINYIYNTDPSNVITITLNEGEVYYGFIVSNSDVKINGKGSFSGSIVTSKNVFIDDANEKTIKYNESVVLRGLANYSKLFNSFKTYTKHKLKYYSTEIYSKDIPEGVVVNVDYSQLLKFTNWEISN